MMKLRLETARLILYRAAWAKQQGGSAGVEASLAKLHLGEAWIQSCLDAVQIHGGYGYMTEYEAERDLRDAVGGTLILGHIGDPEGAHRREGWGYDARAIKMSSRRREAPVGTYCRCNYSRLWGTDLSDTAAARAG